MSNGIIRQLIFKTNVVVVVQTLLCCSIIFIVFIGVVEWSLEKKYSSATQLTFSRIFTKSNQINNPLWKPPASNKTISYRGSNGSSSRLRQKKKKNCPLVSPLLVGWMDISNVVLAIWNEDKVAGRPNINHTGLKFGGKYAPSSCQSRNKVAIVVPYRDRKDHLKIFLGYMHPFLQRQQLEYAIIIVEQSVGLPFNRGMLMNIGFKEALLNESFDCFIFHDVDLLPEDDRNLYNCPANGSPRQMAFSLDIYDYIPTPVAYFGGVSAFTTTDFQLVNGFSNVFWGWGSEDDDLYRRVLFHNLSVSRKFDDDPHLMRIARYRMLDHRQADPNPVRMTLFDEGKQRQKTDGLIDLKYQKRRVIFNQLFTHIIVEIQQKNTEN